MTPQDKLESLRAKLAEHARLTRNLAGALEVFERELLQLKRENAVLRNRQKAPDDNPWGCTNTQACECPDCFRVWNKG